MEIGMCIFSGISYEKQIECFKKEGINRTFITSELPDFHEVIKAFQENGIICETLHSPFNRINDMWKDDESGDAMLKRLFDCVDKCAQYSIPTMILHVSSGRPMPEITEAGNKRFGQLMEYAKEKNVNVAFENLRYLENLQHNMERYPEAFFCWDSGHENCYTSGIRYVPMYKNRIGALHIHDNACVADSDDHLLPFDGNIDFEAVAKDLAESGYEGTLMLEISKESKRNGEKIYENVSPEEYVKKAANAARKLVSMIESYKIE